MRISVVVGFPLLALLIGLGAPLLHAWVGDGFGGAVGPLAMLAAALIFTAPLRFGVIWAIGTGRLRRVALTTIGEAALNLALSIALVGPLGLSGVALATLIAAVLANGVVLPNFILPDAGLGRWSTFWRPGRDRHRGDAARDRAAAVGGHAGRRRLAPAHGGRDDRADRRLHRRCSRRSC